MTRYQLVLAFAVAAAAVQQPGLRAQNPPTQNPQTPPGVTFQVEVNYVDVDAVVTDEKGNFINDLTREEFEVFEDGKPQKVEMFSFVEIPVVKGDRFRMLDRPVTVDTQTNREPFTGRLYVIVLDDLDVSAMRTAIVKKAARQFVEEYMGANDVAAVLYTSGRTDGAQEFTTNKQLVLAAIDKFIGRRMRSLTLERLDQYYMTLVPREPDSSGENSESQASTDPGGHGRMADPTEMERGFRAVGVLDTLRNTAEFLATVRGRRKAVLFFSEGIDYPITDVFGSHNATDVIRATRDAITMAARSNVNYYTIDPRGLVGMTAEWMEMNGSGAPELAGGASFSTPGTNSPITSITGGAGPFIAQNELMHELMLSQGSLKELAEQTGGIAAVNANVLTSAFERIVEANSRYYVLGYYPPNHPRDGRFHKIEVRVKRPGARVQARKGYASPRGRTAEERKRDEDARRAREARRPNADRTSDQLRELLTSPMQQPGLTMSVQAAPFKSAQKDASVALAIDIEGNRLQYAPPDAQGRHANKIELSLYGISDNGKAMAGTRSVLDLTLRTETRDRVSAHGVRVNPRITLPPGRYQLRIGARDPIGGLTGTVFYDLEVPDFKKDKLMIGGLLLTAQSSLQTPSIQPDPVVEKLLPAPATSRRTFPQNDVVALYTEIYDNMTTRQARRIDVAARLLSESGTEAYVSRDELTNNTGQGQKPWEIFGYTKQIPLKDLAPGRYLLRVEAQARGTDDVKPVARETVITVQ